MSPGSKVNLVLMVSLVPLVMLGRGVCNYLNNYLMGWVAIRAICDLRARLFEHLLNLPLSFLSRTSTGELMSRISVNVCILPKYDRLLPGDADQGTSQHAFTARAGFWIQHQI